MDDKFPLRPLLGSSISRRQLLGKARDSLAGLAVASVLVGCEVDADSASLDGTHPNPFLHGVASGDPLTDSVILWTRVTTSRYDAVPVTWRLARDPNLQDIVATGEALAVDEHDYTVHIDPGGLEAGSVYYYQFSALGHDSAIGRTRTAPSGHIERLRLAFCSCSSYSHGFFNAYRALANRRDIDAVLHLGDYIYEYGPGQYASDRMENDGRIVEPGHDIVQLQDYRTRYAQYRLDPDLQAVHQQHPFIAIWDDHESANDSWMHGAENHDEQTQGRWEVRRAIAEKVFHEWLPIRPYAADHYQRIYRSFRFGDLVDLFMLDTRLYGRDEPAHRIPIDARTLQDPNRQMLGAEQESWLEHGLYSSNCTWKLIGQQVMFAQLNLLPALPILSNLMDRTKLIGPIVGAMPLVGNLISGDGQLLNVDQWDGYPAARARVMNMLANIDNPIVLSGDIHTSWANELTPTPNNRVRYSPITGRGSIGVEFITPSITSPGLGILDPVADSLRVVNPHIKYVDLRRHGYVLLDITHERTQAEWWYIDTLYQRSATEYFGKAFTVTAGSPVLATSRQVTQARPDAPPLAPMTPRTTT
ncbi:hypothetical protein CAI21_08610 [Alkalilimnicola ehrlichii]|uniref:Alkaline phosphatase n=1 Tax=Alkalilimnicola ehrlichii TaxID=351052 RepID=A0A3E0WWU9_9GAMM|nr:alkaline phosphatase D family protein [Alkalilimnicola ehrlichii]RFA29885.1 hypothetical protein CAI21_08610 [Alkalilimnicola ehrlichii]RFA36475.1 hypothetical protein CAL65_10885 [Alkalilimnicola ehrlichii]